MTACAPMIMKVACRALPADMVCAVATAVHERKLKSVCAGARAQVRAHEEGCAWYMRWGASAICPNRARQRAVQPAVGMDAACSGPLQVGLSGGTLCVKQGVGCIQERIQQHTAESKP